MSPAEWEQYNSYMEPEPFISGIEFVPPSPEDGMRMLCRGYHINGGPYVQVWLSSAGMIGVQHDDADIVWKARWPTMSLYPSKRAYREETDIHFALLMRERHVYPLSFTSWRTEQP